jgi:hypothetical protein
MTDHPRGNGPRVPPLGYSVSDAPDLGWPPSDDAPAKTDPDAKPEPATKDG